MKRKSNTHVAILLPLLYFQKFRTCFARLKWSSGNCTESQNTPDQNLKQMTCGRMNTTASALYQPKSEWMQKMHKRRDTCAKSWKSCTMASTGIKIAASL